MRKKTKKVDIIIIAVILLIIAAVVFAVMVKPEEKEQPVNVNAGSTGSAVEDRPFSYYADNKKIGVITGGLYEVMIKERYPKADLYQYNNQADLGAALDAGLIDCFTVPRSTAEDFKKQYDGFTYLNEVFTQIPYGFAFEKSADKEYLRDQMNDFLKKIHSDGTYDEIVSVWFGNDENKKVVDESGLTGENGSLKMVTTATMQPFSYIKEGKNVGLEIDLVTRFCREYGYSLSIDSAEFASLIPGITSSMYNIAAGNIMITAERAESVNFSDVYYTADAVAVVKDEIQPNISGGISKDTPLSYFADKKIGILTGSAYEPVAEELFPNAEYVYFDVASDLALATVSGKIDGYLMSVDQAETMKAENPQLIFLNDDAGQTPYAFAFPKTDKGAALRDKINEFLGKIRADGTMDKLLEKWVNGDLEQSVDMTGFTGEKGVLKIASDGTTPPWEYTYSGKLTGYEIELVCMFCRENGYTPSFDTMTFAAVIPAISSEKYDMAAANISITKERAESVYFSDKESGSKVVFVTADISSQTGSDENNTDFLESIAESFEKNFIREDRWKMILDGIGTTCLITVMSTLFGTLLAFLICMFRRTGSSLANSISNIYVKLLQGTPMVVLLMILYYVILGKSGLDAVWVAIIGFSLNVGAYVSEIMRSGIESIDGGQREAALALGYSETQAFFRFIFPQAAVRFLPVYKQEIVSLLKSTSIVGYIAIQDLTKMSDIIRSRTYEAFFPLIATAIIYFILAWIISIILKFVLKAVSPKRKRGAAK